MGVFHPALMGSTPGLTALELSRAGSHVWLLTHHTSRKNTSGVRVPLGGGVKETPLWQKPV